MFHPISELRRNRRGVSRGKMIIATNRLQEGTGALVIGEAAHRFVQGLRAAARRPDDSIRCELRYDLN